MAARCGRLCERDAVEAFCLRRHQINDYCMRRAEGAVTQA